MAISFTAAALKGYPPEARAFAETNLRILVPLPPILGALLLREIKNYDWLFPAERRELQAQVAALGRPNEIELRTVVTRFEKLPVSPALASYDWIVDPDGFVEKITAYLWSVHAIDAFRDVGVAYGEQLAKLRAQLPGPSDRWCIVLAGKGSAIPNRPMFQKLRPHGTYFPQVEMREAVELARLLLTRRAVDSPDRYAHWHIDGGNVEAKTVTDTTRTSVLSYEDLAPLRASLLQRMEKARTSGSVGPEDLRSQMAQMNNTELTDSVLKSDKKLQHFALRVLTEGAGTQIFSTTFVQWAAREALRRANPQTLLLRYAPRQIDRPMDDLIGITAQSLQLDPEGSLRDAEMGAYYTWLNLLRLSPSNEVRFLVLHEGGRAAVAIAPGMAAGANSPKACDVERLLQWMS